jgi:DNA-binding transcriptional LysR family regulator
MLRRFRAACPEVHVLVREGSTEGRVRKVATGEVDVGLIPLPVDTRRVVAEPLMRERTVAALPGGQSVVQEARATHTIVSLVAAGMGISLVQRSVQRLALRGVTYWPMIDAPVAEFSRVTTRSGASR